jgi:hypothetical protein
MFCKACGNQVLEGVGFCGKCGAPVGSPEDVPSSVSADVATDAPTMVRSPVPSPPPVASPPPVPPPLASTPPVPQPPAHTPPPPTEIRAGYANQGTAGPGGFAPYGAGAPRAYGGPPVPPSRGRLGLWLGIAAAAVIVIGAGLALWLLVFDKDDDKTTTTRVVQTTSTTGPEATTTSVASSSTSTSTTIPITGDPGDSPGEWVEMDNSAFPGGVYAAAVSDDALLIDAETADGYALYAYMLDSEALIELPIGAPDFYDEDIDGRLAVWWEGTYDEGTDTYTDERICAYLLPDGPKVYVTEAGRGAYYPQVAGNWITWVESTPWEENPEEYLLMKIFGVEVNSLGEPQGDPSELVSAATSYAMGDSIWTYSLSGTHLAWENATAVDSYDPGAYTMDFGRFQPLIVGSETWRPSLAEDTLVYYQDGLKAMDLTTERVWEIDALGDSPTAGPTFAAYFRSVDGDETTYEIVARGYSGGHEQVLGEQPDPPWLSPILAASANHIAFIVDETVHLFEWQGPRTY